MGLRHRLEGALTRGTALGRRGRGSCEWADAACRNLAGSGGCRRARQCTRDADPGLRRPRADLDARRSRRTGVAQHSRRGRPKRAPRPQDPLGRWTGWLPFGGGSSRNLDLPELPGIESPKLDAALVDGCDSALSLLRALEGVFPTYGTPAGSSRAELNPGPSKPTSWPPSRLLSGASREPSRASCRPAGRVVD